ncbi:MAG: tetratricopeptide repeat protein [Desulfarculales bacterium]|nr:tetratricopeptide repeat protein [Desulfarculales bacterium]
MAILILLLNAGGVWAARLNQASLTSEGQISRLLLFFDMPAEYSLDLLDPRVVALRLPGSISGTGMPVPGGDSIIEAVTANSNSQGLDIIIRTRGAGATVQPSFDETSNILTLEFRGGILPPAGAAANDAPPQITAITLGGRSDAVRLQLSGDKRMSATVHGNGDVVLLNLERGGLDPEVQIYGSDERVLAMEIQNLQPFAVMLKLSRQLDSYQIAPQDDGLILDMILAGSRVPPPPPPSGRPVEIPSPPPAPSSLPSGALTQEPASSSLSAAGPLPDGDEDDLLLSPSSVAQVQGHSARGAMPPLLPPVAPGGLTVVAGPDDSEGPPAAVGDRQPQGGMVGASLAGGDLAAAVTSLEEGRYSEALSGFENVLQSSPSPEQAAKAAYGMAEAYFRMNQHDITFYYTRIMDMYQAAMVNYPDSDQVPKAMLMMGRAAGMAGENYRARAYYQWLQSRYRDSDAAAWSQIYLGNLENSEGNYGRAIEMFTNALVLWPDSAITNSAYMGLLQSYFGLAQWQNAITMIDALLARNPGMYLEQPEMLHYLGEAHYQLQDYGKARDYLLWAYNLQPGSIKDGDILLTRIGDTYRFEKAYRASGEIYNQAVASFPNSEGGQVAKMRLAEVEEEDSEHPWEVFQVRPNNAAYRIYLNTMEQFASKPVGQLATLKLAVWYYKTTAFSQSIQTAQDLLSGHPETIFRTETEYVLDLSARARLRELRDENDPAGLLKEYVRLRPHLKQPESEDMLQMLAWGYENSGLYDKAAHLWQVLGARNPGKPNYWVDAARNLFVEDKQEEVLEVLKEVNLDELDPERQQEFLFLEGVSLNRRGRYSEAALALQALIKRDMPDNYAGQAFMNLGTALSHMPGREQDALRSLDLAEYELGKEPDQEAMRSLRLLTTLQAGVLAQRLDDKNAALGYLQKALQLSRDPKDRAPVLYEIFLSQRALGQTGEMMKSLEELAGLNISPWSDTAQTILADYRMAPELQRVGRQLREAGAGAAGEPAPAN